MGRRYSLASLTDAEILAAAGDGATLEVFRYGTALCARCGAHDDSVGPALEVTGEDIDLCRRCWWKANNEDNRKKGK